MGQMYYTRTGSPPAPRLCSRKARTTGAVPSALSERLRPPRSRKVYISFSTMSVPGPTPLWKTSVASTRGVRISRYPNRRAASWILASSHRHRPVWSGRMSGMPRGAVMATVFIPMPSDAARLAGRCGPPTPSRQRPPRPRPRKTRWPRAGPARTSTPPGTAEPPPPHGEGAHRHREGRAPHERSARHPAEQEEPSPHHDGAAPEDEDLGGRRDGRGQDRRREVSLPPQRGRSQRPQGDDRPPEASGHGTPPGGRPLPPEERRRHALDRGSHKEHGRDEHPGDRLPRRAGEEVQEEPEDPDPGRLGDAPHARPPHRCGLEEELPHPRRVFRGSGSGRTAFGHPRRGLSRRIVTGPSLWISTTMWAPKRPGTTRTPDASSCWLKYRYSGSARSGGAASTKLGRRPRRVSAYRVNCGTLRTSPPISTRERLSFPASSSKILSPATRLARRAASSGVSCAWTPRRTT